MNKRKLLAALLGCAILCLSLLTGCADRITLQESGGACVGKNGVTYQHASTCYVPVSLGDECGTLEVSSKRSLALHEIPHMDPDEWLSTEDGEILYAEDVSLPTLADMEPTAVYVYTNTAILSKSTEIADPAVVGELVAACGEGKGESFTPMATATHLVRFKSEKYPGIYFSLRYVEYGDECYLYDQFNGVTYTVGSQIRDALDKVSDGSTESNAETTPTANL